MHEFKTITGKHRDYYIAELSSLKWAYGWVVPDRVNQEAGQTHSKEEALEFVKRLQIDDEDWSKYLAWCESKKQIPWLQQYAAGAWREEAK